MWPGSCMAANKKHTNVKYNKENIHAVSTHGMQGKRNKTKARKKQRLGGVKPLGSKYLDRAPSGLRIDMLSEGSCCAYKI